MTLADLHEACTDPAQIIAGLKAYAAWIEEDPTIEDEERTLIIGDIIADILMAGG